MTAEYPEMVEPDEGPLDGSTEWAAEPLPVVNVSERNAPEYGSCMSYIVAQVGVSFQPTQILPRRLRRYKAYIFIRTTTACNVFLNNNINALMNPVPQGWIAHAGANSNFAFSPEWDSQQALYAISTAVDTEIDILDFSYAER